MTSNREIYGVDNRSEEERDREERKNWKKTKFGTWLMDRRDESGLSQLEFARSCGANGRQMHLMLTGQMKPDTQIVLKLMDKYTVGAKDMMELLEIVNVE